MINLKQEHIQLLKRVLQENIPDARVVAYGSRVKGDAWEFSDLDLCVMNKKPLSIPVSHIKEILTESHLPMLVDIVEWSKLSPEFQGEIGKKYEIIQEGTGH